MAREAVLRPVLWVLLGAWIGGLAFFGVGVAPAVLRHAPSPLAGELIRSTLSVLDWGGVATGLILGGVALALRRGAVAIGLPLLLGAFCVASQLWVAPAIANARPTATTQARPAAGAALRFRNLHRFSVGLYGATLVGALGLAALHGRREASLRSRGDSPA